MTEPREVMIYHVPYPLDASAGTGSAIRPVKMREAFEANGYEVWEVSGYSRQRMRQIRDIKRRIRDGARPAFVYSESSSMPTPMTDPHHLPLHPRLDLGFLRFCRKQGIATGVFYRDIYWQFAEYLTSVNRIVALGTRFLYRRDLRMYRNAVDVIFLPSEQMAAYLPERNRLQAVALPPGAESIDTPTIAHSGLNLLFVGGLGNYYRAHECVRGVSMAKTAHLTICTREQQWKQLSHEYEQLLGDTTNVVHESGDGLVPLFAAADIGVLFLEPVEYREFAAPIKLFEYLGNGKPIIATEGSLAGRFVEENGVGWTISYDASALAALLDRLTADPAELARTVEKVRAVRGLHTWQARASQAASALRRAVSERSGSWSR